MTAALASLLIRLFVSKWSDRLGRGLFVSVGLCFYAASMGIIAEADRGSLFLLSGALEGIGSGLFVPAVMSLVADRTLPHERGYVLGLTWIGFDLGIATAGPIFGACVDWLSLTGVYGGSSTILNCPDHILPLWESHCEQFSGFCSGSIKGRLCVGLAS